MFGLQLLVEITRRTGNVNPARNVALTVFYPLYDTRRLATLRAIGALAGVHDLFAVSCFCDLRHCSLLNSRQGTTSVVPITSLYLSSLTVPLCRDGKGSGFRHFPQVVNAAARSS